MYFWCGCDVWGKILKNYDVSIIVPIYNVEKFIAKCVTTLMEQDYENIEYIFVNDCTPDNSMQVLSDTLAKYPNRKDDIKIINNAQNSGSSITRKNGLDIANGEYILFIDSDDWVELNMVSSMLKKAKETDADIVCCDYYINYKNKENYCPQNCDYSKPKILISLLSYGLEPSLVIKLLKSSVLKNIQFPSFSYGEDMFVCVQAFYYANNIRYINKAFYHYNKTNENSITTNNANINKNIQQACELNLKIQEFLKEKSIFKQCISYHYQRMLILALYNIADDMSFKNCISKICPEANKIKYIWENKNLSFIRKIIYSIAFFGFDKIFLKIRNIYIRFKYE